MFKTPTPNLVRPVRRAVVTHETKQKDYLLSEEEITVLYHDSFRNLSNYFDTLVLLLLRPREDEEYIRSTLEKHTLDTVKLAETQAKYYVERSLQLSNLSYEAFSEMINASPEKYAFAKIRSAVLSGLKSMNMTAKEGGLEKELQKA